MVAWNDAGDLPAMPDDPIGLARLNLGEHPRRVLPQLTNSDRLHPHKLPKYLRTSTDGPAPISNAQRTRAGEATVSHHFATLVPNQAVGPDEIRTLREVLSDDTTGDEHGSSPRFGQWRLDTEPGCADGEEHLTHDQ